MIYMELMTKDDKFEFRPTLVFDLDDFDEVDWLDFFDPMDEHLLNEDFDPLTGEVG